MSNLHAKNVRFVAVDFETTGSDPLTARVTEIGTVTYENGEEVERWGTLVNPQEAIPEEVEKLTGITNAMVAKEKVFAEHVEDLLARLEGNYFLAYNASYDARVLRAELGRLNRPLELRGTIDPLPFCWKYLRKTKKTRNARLGTVAEYLNVELENAHRATDDAAAAAQVYLRLFEEVPEIPTDIAELIEIQAALTVEMEDSFRGPRRGPTISMSEVHLELGPAYIRGRTSDPLQYLFQRLPDVRSIR